MMSKETHSWADQSPYECFYDFIDPEADRFGILLDKINNLRLNSIVITVENNRHFFIFPRAMDIKHFSGGAFPFREQNPVVLTAHYDRVAGSPGANDNSAAVFLLLKAAIVLNRRNIGHWIIIFTDKEELITGEGIRKQGSFSLALKLRQWGLSRAQIFNFDACGTGDAFVFSSTTDYLLNKNPTPGLQRANHSITFLRDKAYKTAGRLNLKKALSVPVPFSDDAGFLKGGIPSQTITMLPADEADSYAALLHDHPEFIDMIIAGSNKISAIHQLVPETWRCINGPLDCHERLTPEHYDDIVRFAAELCR
ncbi:MAG: M28 family metallopeptidase [Treponema sp.]|nr:M28 family metallopeptidase [Treponema sp.]